MQSTSENGIAYLDSREGVVLKAYRDAVGVLTIGAGLTAASGVIVPKPGMVITRAQASALMREALAKNYEPAVRKAMGDVVPQHAFDGGSSFHWNTGAIGRASWVKAWKRRDDKGVRNGLLNWIKGGGRVLPGLQRRRREEADIILHGKWPVDLKVATLEHANETPNALVVISLSASELANVRDGFRRVGFDPGPNAGHVLRSSVEAFQRKYDLTVDGKIGRATLSTLQRELDARKGVVNGSGTTVAGGGGAAGVEMAAPDPSTMPIDPALLHWLAAGAAIAGAAYLAYLAWHYRDMIAARLGGRLPRLATWLRSF